MRSRFGQVTLDIPPWAYDDAALAYVTLEQSRRMVERLLARPQRVGHHELLAAARAALGRTGYLASDGLDSALRLALSELARDFGPADVPPASDDLERAFLLARHAQRPVAALDELSPMHIRAALVEAVRALRVVLGRDRASDLGTRAALAGVMEPSWQRRHLPPLPWNLPLRADDAAPHGRAVVRRQA